MATHRDIHGHVAGEVDTRRLPGATVTIMYLTPTKMVIMGRCGANGASSLTDPQWRAQCIMQA